MGQMWEISVTVEAADGSEGFVLVTQLCILDQFTVETIFKNQVLHFEGSQQQLKKQKCILSNGHITGELNNS